MLLVLKKRAGEFTKQSVDETMKTVIYGDVIKHYEKLAKGKQAIVYTHSVEASETSLRRLMKLVIILWQ